MGEGGAKGAKGVKVGLRFPDEEGAEAVRAVLSYESAVRGRPVGRTLFDLVMEGADLASYPEEVLARLREIAEQVEDETVKGLLPPEGGGK